VLVAVVLMPGLMMRRYEKSSENKFAILFSPSFPFSSLTLFTWIWEKDQFLEAFTLEGENIRKQGRK
jgi:hypothetical protein